MLMSKSKGENCHVSYGQLEMTSVSKQSVPLPETWAELKLWVGSETPERHKVLLYILLSFTYPHIHTPTVQRVSCTVSCLVLICCCCCWLCVKRFVWKLVWVAMCACICLHVYSLGTCACVYFHRIPESLFTWNPKSMHMSWNIIFKNMERKWGKME